MSLQWTLASVFLYSEVIFVISLLIPGISPKRWLTLFNSQSVQVINRKAHLFFNFTIVVLTIFLLDAIREIYRYDAAIELEASKSSASMSAGMQPTPTREFRAQRNLYIAGMSLFLWFVIKRLVVLISNAAVLIDDYELADNECKELRRELELAKTKYDTFTAVVNSSTSTTTSTEDKAKFAEEKAEKAAEERLRSRSKSRKEQ